MKASPVEAELKICLTPQNKIQEVIEKSSGKSKKGTTKEKVGGKTEGKAARTLFDVEQNQTDIVEEVIKQFHCTVVVCIERMA